MQAFFLIYLISCIAEVDGLGRTESPACLAAYAAAGYKVYLARFCGLLLDGFLFHSLRFGGF